MVDLRKKDIQKLSTDLLETIKNLDLENKRERLINLQNETLKENFWSNSENAREIMTEVGELQEEINNIDSLKGDINYLVEIFDSTKKETEQNNLIEEYESLREKLDKFSLMKFLSGKYDNANCILSIHAGQGGTEANDWAQILFRMYTMYCEKQGWKYTLQNMVKGNEAGISTVTILITGKYAYGYLKKETGTHRLVRISPFNAQGLRQTTFAGVEILPVMEELDKEVDIPEKDLDFKAVLSGGPGGQNVNKTSSAVMITHIPTGITVHSSNERSQAQNRQNAMGMLKAKLWRIKQEERVDEISQIKGDYKIAGWGNQIRNYILHPYKLVRDLRTNIESSDPEGVLNGNLEKFIEAQIKLK